MLEIKLDNDLDESEFHEQNPIKFEGKIWGQSREVICHRQSRLGVMVMVGYSFDQGTRAESRQK